MTRALVLASASPRRRALLSELGVDFEALASDVPEQPLAGEDARAFATRVAREKAIEVAAERPGHWVLAADTVVIRHDGEILGKPVDPDDARRMLRGLSGCAHRVLTAVTLLPPAGTPVDEILVESTVTFRALDEVEIAAYVGSGEPFDKAGAYAIQGAAGRFVIAVAGSYTNVVGLPVDEVRVLLRRHGLLPSAANAVEPSR